MAAGHSPAVSYLSGPSFAGEKSERIPETPQRAYEWVISGYPRPLEPRYLETSIVKNGKVFKYDQRQPWASIKRIHQYPGLQAAKLLAARQQYVGDYNECLFPLERERGSR